MTSVGNSTNNTNNSGGGSSTHRKLKGTAEVVHGIGENIRGRVMNVLDSGSGAGGGHLEAEQGSREVERGMAKLTGGPGIDGVAHRGTGTGGGTSTTSAPLAHEGNLNGAPPASTGTAGFNAGPAAEAGFQPQNASSGAGPPLQGGSNDRDFYPGDSTDMPHQPSTIPQECAAATTGPAPDRSTLAGSPQRLG
ncbi:hypothetical protein C2E23DRAFT_850815 [Lenzites betulinus]|nr:hypothetical protein C2E23DRAFT_850815 [Lenzites betulinus]